MGTKLTIAKIQSLSAIKRIHKIYDDSSVKISGRNYRFSNVGPNHPISHEDSLVNVYEAIYNNTACANQGLDITANLARTTAHFGGPTSKDENSGYYIIGLDGYLWSDCYL